MTAATVSLDRSAFLRRILFVDAATCVAMGMFLVLLAQPLAPLLGLPAGLLEIAGASLLPIAAFMGWVATRGAFLRSGARLVVAGNVAWIGASVLLLAGGWVAPTVLGYLFVAVQACAVALLAALEYAAYSRL
jgi:hypothetical protein